MFKKIKLFIPELHVDALDKHLYYSAAYGPDFNIYGIENYHKEYIAALVVDKIKFHIPFDDVGVVKINGDGVRPHIDHRGTGLNYYIRTPPATTLFWEPETPTLEGIPVGIDLPDGGQKSSEAVDYSTMPLRQIGSFQTKSHEAWLLDVSRIHSVEKNYQNIDRVYIRWNWSNHSYDEILASIEILPPI
jgi:hypothetical protein